MVPGSLKNRGSGARGSRGKNEWAMSKNTPIVVVVARLCVEEGTPEQACLGAAHIAEGPPHVKNFVDDTNFAELTKNLVLGRCSFTVRVQDVFLTPEEWRRLQVPYCACGRRQDACDGSRAACPKKVCKPDESCARVQNVRCFRRA